MAKFTNHTQGLRGIRLKSGEMVWLDVGKSVDLKKEDIAEPMPDLGTKSAIEADSGGDERVRLAVEEVSRRAQDHIDQLTTDHSRVVAALTDRAEAAEDSLSEANGKIEDLAAQLAKFDPDGNGKPGGSTAGIGEAASDDSVKTALDLLDTTKDSDWTAAGLPAVEAVAELAGGKVTREQIKALAPDLTRETAKKG